MDTNLVSLLIQQLAAKSAPAVSPGLEGLKLILNLVGPLLTTMLAAIILYLQTKTAASVKEVHTAVNSERTASLLEIKELRADIAVMNQNKALSDQRQSEALVVAQTKIAASSKP